MELRNILLQAEYGEYDDRFFITFKDNTNFISNFLSRKIRSYHIKTDGTYNLLCISLTTGSNNCRICHVNSLSVKLHFSNEDKENYLKMKNETERFELYLSLLEQGYAIANTLRTIPTDILLTLHELFRNCGYVNEWLFKNKLIKSHSIKVTLTHVLTSYHYQLKLLIHNLDNEYIGEGCIYKTLPDEIFFKKKVRHLIVENGKLIVSDFLDHPQFVCKLSDLQKGIVKAICVDEHTKKYIPNENNKEMFERLKW